MSVPSAGPRGGRPARVTADDVVRTALDLGVATFTVSRVAHSLGVSPASVQRHFPTRDDLLDECLRRICTLIPTVPAGAGWRETLETMIEGEWLMFTRYPGLDAVWRTYTRPLETVWPDSLTFYAHLAAQGFSVRQAAFAGYCTTRLTSAAASRLHHRPSDIAEIRRQWQLSVQVVLDHLESLDGNWPEQVGAFFEPRRTTAQ